MQLRTTFWLAVSQMMIKETAIPIQKTWRCLTDSFAAPYFHLA